MQICQQILVKIPNMELPGNPPGVGVVVVGGGGLLLKHDMLTDKRVMTKLIVSFRRCFYQSA